MFAEALLEKEQFDTMTQNAVNFYTTLMFNRQTAHLVSGNLFRIEQEPVVEPVVVPESEA